MKLYQVRKGQFVFYQNELHKVYTVKHMFKKSVHLYRMKDMKQVLTSANEITLYKPKHNDTFIFYGKRYTIDENRRPNPGDYILITKPAPDFLDHYSLNSIEKVASVEDGNVVTTRDNGVKHHEYVVMVPGKAEASQEIAYYDKNLVPEEQQIQDESISYLMDSDEDIVKPVVGDVFLDVETNTKAMVVAMSGTEVVFGHGKKVHIAELFDEEKYQVVFRILEDL
ncbi:hypothetical protein [Ornithinibacillus halotolerans]|uniref:Uncharacterized protein n=1 Tax=Ornithinibacillus halotolerans TaxID=1274357 RepID=A0A916SAL2_9BACI|nr:hypothetical protein [Ornithinibacillus halotolerans]GGA88878.1 hypothetical protein GCM10008025_34390 [Ornithinibacillus halotolerans]